MSINPSILCPHCGSEIVLEAKAVQGELALGPIEFRPPGFSEAVRRSLGNNLDENSDRSVNSNGSRVFPSLIARQSASRTSTRVHDTRPASCEEDLLDSIRSIVGDTEWQRNGGLWRLRERENPRALYHAIEDWKLRTPDQQRAIKNRGAWLTDRFQRARSISQPEKRSEVK